MTDEVLRARGAGLGDKGIERRISIVRRELPAEVEVGWV